MMTIGQFARASGLTVKALRFYDERGLLVPAQVDPATGYRRYRASQLRDAVALQALRAADVGLDEARGVIDDRDRTVELIDRIQARRDAERAGQDAALTRARSVLEAMHDGPHILERDVPARRWVGLRWVHGPGEDLDEHGEAIDAEIGALGETLTACSAPAAGPPWFVHSGDGTPTAAVTLGRFPVDNADTTDLDALAAALDERVEARRGVLERGCDPPCREAYARVPLPSPPDAGAMLVPAIVALGEYLEDARHDVGEELRQRSMTGDDGEVVALEYAGVLRTP